MPDLNRLFQNIKVTESLVGLMRMLQRLLLVVSNCTTWQQFSSMERGTSYIFLCVKNTSWSTLQSPSIYLLLSSLNLLQIFRQEALAKSLTFHIHFTDRSVVSRIASYYLFLIFKKADKLTLGEKVITCPIANVGHVITMQIRFLGKILETWCQVTIKLQMDQCLNQCNIGSYVLHPIL